MAWDADEEIAKVNARLSAALMATSIRRKNNKLYLRGTFPPRPGSGKSEPHQQDIALGINASPEGIRAAEAKAKLVSSQLDWGKFDWEPFLKKSQPDGKTGNTVGEWVEKTRKFYFSTRQSRAAANTWEKDYQAIYDRLPFKSPLTEQLLIDALCQIEPNSRTRKRAYNAFRFLVRNVAQHLDIKKLQPYRGNYLLEGIDERDIPSDADIEKYRLQILDPRHRWCYGLIAAYGIRPHELWHLDFSQMAEAPGILKILKNTKTGARKVWPLPGKWWQEWKLWEIHQLEPPPRFHKSGNNNDLQFSPIFARYDIPFPPYALRHAWAIRSAIAGISPSIAAKMMGHSLATHSSRYHAWMDDAALQQAWERASKELID